jgi:hypothetical protein
MHVREWEDVSPPGLAGFWGSPSGGEVTLPAFPGLQKLSPNDLGSIVDTANAVGIEPDWLATIINFETGGTFSTRQKNAAGSGATGLIQFMPDTAQKLLGTSTPAEAIARLEAMSFPEQMKVVEQYFAPHAGKMKSLSDAYMAVLYPAFLESPDSAVMGRAGSAIYTQNRGFDTENKGYITKADVARAIQSSLESARGKVATGIPLGRRGTRLRTMWTGIAIAAAAGAFALGIVYLASPPEPRRIPRRVPVPA